ncbi:MAG: hypothetical protein BGO13_00225 [Burkholderiales bacterium 66-5]|nr:MAG: hypothetical protein BGO13_00225 [Burkholderiales bacterium 66-5]
MQTENIRPPSLESVNDVSRRIGRSTRWVWAAVAKGDFPAPVRMSARCTRWDGRAVDRWIEEQLATAE